MRDSLAKAFTGVVFFIVGYIAYNILRRTRYVDIYEKEPEDYGTPVAPV